MKIFVVPSNILKNIREIIFEGKTALRMKKTHKKAMKIQKFSEDIFPKNKDKNIFLFQGGRYNFD